MLLADVIRRIDEWDADATMCAVQPWTPSSEAVVMVLPGDKVPDDVKRAGFSYFLEVHVTREIFEDVAHVELTPEERVDAIIFYATNDAFPDWLDDRARRG